MRSRESMYNLGRTRTSAPYNFVDVDRNFIRFALSVFSFDGCLLFLLFGLSCGQNYIYIFLSSTSFSPKVLMQFSVPLQPAIFSYLCRVACACSCWYGVEHRSSCESRIALGDILGNLDALNYACVAEMQMRRVMSWASVRESAEAFEEIHLMADPRWLDVGFSV